MESRFNEAWIIATLLYSNVLFFLSTQVEILKQIILA